MGSSFLAYNGTLYAPVVGILSADFVFVRRLRINMWAVFDDDPAAEYYYTRGFHWPALACLVLGQAIYFAMLDPLSYASHDLFLYTTASLPSCIVPGIVYGFWMKFWPPPMAVGHPARVAQPNI